MNKDIKNTLMSVWKQRLELYVAADRLLILGNKRIKEGNNLQYLAPKILIDLKDANDAKNEKIIAAYGYQRAVGEEICASGSMRKAEGNKMRAEGDRLWAEKILHLLGNKKILWVKGNCIIDSVKFKNI